MKKIIIDTNIAFSAILNINSRIGQIIIAGSRFYDFYAPEYIKAELIEHKDKIKKIGKFTDNEFVELYEMVLRNISILNHSLIPIDILLAAEELCKDIDIDDTPFVATADFIRGRLWTGDGPLTEKLQLKGYNRIISTTELYQDFLLKDKGRK